MREIVAAKIGSKITNDLEKIINAARANRLSELYDRSQMRFMSACDVGENWTKLAEGPTIFFLDAGNKIQWPEQKIAP